MSSLFTDNFPVVRNHKELVALQARYPQYDTYYVASGSIPDRKERFEKLYDCYKSYADRHFLNEVKKSFHQRSWEMYLACILLDRGLEVVSSDVGPDVKAIINNRTIWIECIAPTRGETEDQVPDPLMPGLQPVPEHEMLLRLSSSLEAKYQKYKEYLEKSIISSHDPYVIAVNRGLLGHVDGEIALIIKCLFGLGSLTLSMTITTDGSDPVGEPSSGYARRVLLPKKSGSSVPMKFFEEKEHAGVSAVIYSMDTVLNHPKQLGGDCIVVHNPLAQNPIEATTLPFTEQYIIEGEYLVKAK